MSHTADLDPEDIGSSHEQLGSDQQRVQDVEHRPEPAPARTENADGGGRSSSEGRAEQDALPGLPPGATSEFIQSLTVAASYSGPVLPEHLEQYERVVPGCAADIVQAQLISPQRRLDRLADGEIRTAKTGQAWAIFLAIVCITAAIVFFANANNTAGMAFIGLPLVGLIGSFLPNRKRE